VILEIKKRKEDFFEENGDLSLKNKIPFIKVPPGKFQMGSVNELPYALETPVHKAVISESLSVAVYPVTQEQYQEIMGHNPAKFRHGKNLPVANVNWFDAKKFCQKLSGETGQLLRLPTETEWEYFCRAGSETEFFFGDDKKELVDYAWFEYNSNERTAPVGLKKPNDWGIHDIVGNVWEWCEDVWQSDYTGFPSDGSANLKNIEKQHQRSTRGGSWAMDAFRCRSSYRSHDWTDTKTEKLGFRIVLEEK
jgi:formylglycine-generating enzyme required for sulfatase activity